MSQAKPGDLDRTFSGNGIAYAGFGPSGQGGGTAGSIALQDDGRVLVAGNVGGTGSDGDFGLARFRQSGQLDSSFGDGGTVAIDYFDSSDSASDLAVQSDGRIVVVGRAFTSSAHDEVAVARLMPDGSLDPSFGDGGKEILFVNGPPPGQGDAGAYAVAVRDDGRIFLGGQIFEHRYDDGPGFVARLQPDGHLDPAFATGGTKTIHLPGFHGETAVRDLAIDGRGRLALAVSAARTRRSLERPAVARLRSSGGYDRSFSGDGRRPFFDRAGELNAIAATRGGALVATGSAGTGGRGRCWWPVSARAVNSTTDLPETGSS